MLSAVLIATLMMGAPHTLDDPCSDGLGWIGTCAVDNDNDAVLIRGDSREASGELSRTPSRTDSADQAEQPRDCGALNRCDDFTVSLLPQATIADVASFAPQPAALTSDPAGYAVVGLPVDFAVTASAHSASGTLFDLPVTVRFTPEEIVLTPGDGSALATPSTPTATSHVYRDRGTYVASATVRYRAEVDFGRGWRPVPGTLDIPTAGYAVQVLEARGTLVQRTCTEPPLGPGC